MSLKYAGGSPTIIFKYLRVAKEYWPKQPYPQSVLVIRRHARWKAVLSRDFRVDGQSDLPIAAMNVCSPKSKLEN